VKLASRDVERSQKLVAKAKHSRPTAKASMVNIIVQWQYDNVCCACFIRNICHVAETLNATFFSSVYSIIIYCLLDQFAY